MNAGLRISKEGTTNRFYSLFRTSKGRTRGIPGCQIFATTPHLSLRNADRPKTNLEGPALVAKTRLVSLGTPLRLLLRMNRALPVPIEY